MLVEALSSELERQYDLDELKTLSADLLGFEPDEVGGASAKGSFARALAQRCMDADAVDALIDVVHASHRALPNDLVEGLRLGATDPGERPREGDELGQALILGELGTSATGEAYRVRHAGNTLRWRRLSQAARRRRREVQRYFAASRLVSRVAHAGLPVALSVESRDPNGLYGVSHEFADGDSLETIITERGGRHLNELLPLLWAIAEALAALHAEDLAHGALHPGNVIVTDPSLSSTRVLLVDAGAHHLRPSLAQLPSGRAPSWLSCAPPELLRGEPIDARSDVYALGSLIYQLVSGRGPHHGARALDTALGHLTEEPESLSFVALGSGASPEVDAFVLALLDKDRERRPRSATEALEGLRRMWRASQRPPANVSDELIEQRFAELIAEPWDEQKATEVEALADLGVDAARLADGFFEAARAVRDRGAPGKERHLKRLLVRAARLYESAERHDTAEELYRDLVEEDPGDTAASEALDRLRKKLGKYEELVESLLERTEQSDSPAQRAQYFTEIGKLYQSELGDREQALVAYTQAFLEDPESARNAEQVERLAGSRAAWEDVAQRCLEAAEGDGSNEAKAAIAYQLGRWYADKLGRSDLSQVWLGRAVELAPAHDKALAELAELYRKARHHQELGQVLLKRAEVAPPGLARDLKAEAATILAKEFGSSHAAQDLYRSVLSEDPGHAAATEGMARLLRADGDVIGALGVLEARANALSGDDRRALLCEIADSYEVELDRIADAERFFRKVLAENDGNMDALRGLDRILNRAGRYQELLDVLGRQIEAAVTGRQKVALYERVAAVCDEEFLDHKRAAEALEAALELDAQRPAAVDKLAKHYRALERFQDVAKLYRTQLGVVTDVVRRVELGLALGRTLTELGEVRPAIDAYEGVLVHAPGHGAALEALAVLRAKAGDAESALGVLEALAEQAPTPDARADQYLKAAALLEQRGDQNAALLRYKMAADACPNNAAIARKVRDKYVELGNFAAAVQLYEEELERTQGAHARARVAGEIALIAHRHLLDDDRARTASLLALQLDPTNPQALRVQGRLAYAEERFTEAAKRLEPFISELSSLDPEEAAETAAIYVDSLEKSGAVEKALAAADGLIQFLTEDVSSLLRVSQLYLEHGSAERALALCDLLLSQHEALLSPTELGTVQARRGEALLKAGRRGEAIEALELALEVDPKNPAPLRTLAQAHAAREDWGRTIETRYREFELVKGDDRVKTLIDIAEIASSKLGDSDYAARALLSALAERPNDRNVLAKLMQLYSAEKDWEHLIEVIARLAEVVEDPKQRSKYLYTAAMLAARELGDPHRALEFVDNALFADADNDAALSEGLALRRRLGDFEGVEDLLRRRAQQLAQSDDKSALGEVLSQLAEVCEVHLGRTDQAVRALESALEIEPDDTRLQERLAALYAADAGVYFEQAVRALGAWVRRDPYRPEPYKLLRRVYTDVRRADGAFCACQALHVLGQAEPDEERFFSRMRETEPPDPRSILSSSDWADLVMPEEADPLLTALFALIEPFVLASRAEAPEAFGITPEHQLDAATYPHGFVRAIHNAASALGISEPAMFQRQEDPGVLVFLPTRPPSTLLGAAAFTGGFKPLEEAFVAGHHLAYYQSGFYLRHALPNLTALKSWLFAGIRLVKPKFPVTPDLERSVAEASQVLAQFPSGAGRERLTHVVSKLLSADTALDLKRWVFAVDYCADRAGLIACHDLGAAGRMLQSMPVAQGAPTLEARLESLLCYSVSDRYLELRTRMGVSLDA